MRFLPDYETAETIKVIIEKSGGEGSQDTIENVS